MESKICPTCEQNKELTEYYSTVKKDGSIYYRVECKKCVSLKSQKWRENNPERSKEIDKKYFEKPEMVQYFIDKSIRQRKSGYALDWQRRHPEKLKIYNSLHRDHDITKAEEESMLKVFDYSCAYCGMTLEEHKKKFKQKLHNDHVDEDGYNDLRNDVPACKRCNCGKHEHELEEWYFKQKFFIEEKYKKIVWWTTEGYKNYIEEKPPYKIKRKRNEGLTTYHHELWTVDIYRNMLECIERRVTKKEIIKDLESGVIEMPEIVKTKYSNVI